MGNVAVERLLTKLVCSIAGTGIDEANSIPRSWDSSSDTTNQDWTWMTRPGSQMLESAESQSLGALGR